MNRRWEFDALRGLMLVLMTVTHLPTRLSDPLGQPFGFVSAAEGFVLLSGFMAGIVYTARERRDGAAEVRSAFLQRALKVYVCQAALLVFLLTVVALIGYVADEPAINNLIAFYLERPFTAFFSGLLLVYAPPLLDILPMYVLFLLASPIVLLHGLRHGWGAMLTASVALWLAAQFGLNEQVYRGVVALTGLPVPFQQTGAFDGLAWQFLWVLGLWLGSVQAQPSPPPLVFPRWMVNTALLVGVTGLVWRHAVGQLPFPGQDGLNLMFSKWQLGPLRLINLFALLVLVVHCGETLKRRLPRVRALELLGAQSLPVFCAHLVLVLLALAVFGESGPERAWWVDPLLLVGCFAGLLLVAWIGALLDRAAAASAARLKAARAARRPTALSAGAARSPTARAHSPPR